MISQHIPTRRLDGSGKDRGRFLLAAMVALPALNVVVLLVAVLVAGDGLFVPVAAAVLALVELVLLIALSPKYGVGASGALAAMLGNVLVTMIMVILLFLVFVVISLAIDPPEDGLS